MNPLRTFFASVVILTSLACGRPVNPTPPGDEAFSRQPRNLTTAPQGDLKQAVSNNTDFAFDLYRSLVSGNDNLFFSPHSVTVALAQTYAGANGSTEAAFTKTLKQSLAQDAFHRAMNDLDRQLSSRGTGAKAADGKAFRLNITNQLFAQRDFAFETPFLDLLAQEYGAGVRLMPFITEPEPSRVAINDWVEQRTERRIKELLPKGSISDLTRAVLVNSIYFNAAWRTPFAKELTRPGTFHRLDGSDAQVDMMRVGEISTRAASVNGTEIVELPYDGDELSALIVMPPAGQLAALEASLSSAELDRLLSSLQPEGLSLTMPKIETRTNTSLKDTLSTLGLEVAFSRNADFSKMSREDPLTVSDVLHQAFVQIDEAGTEAAAATAVVVDVRTSVSAGRPVTIDRPFVLLIRDNATGAVVFAGRIAAP